MKIELLASFSRDSREDLTLTNSSCKIFNVSLVPASVASAESVAFCSSAAELAFASISTFADNNDSSSCAIFASKSATTAMLDSSNLVFSSSCGIFSKKIAYLADKQTWPFTALIALSSSLRSLDDPSLASLILEIDPIGREALADGAAEDRETVVTFGGPAGFPEAATLGRAVSGGFLAASAEIEPRGLVGTGVGAGLLAEPIEPVGEARKVTSSSKGFVVAEADRDCLDKAGDVVFAGTRDALRAAVAADLGFADDGAIFVWAEGGDVADFFNAGALGFVVTGALAPVGFTEPIPKVPEFNTCILV